MSLRVSYASVRPRPHFDVDTDWTGQRYIRNLAPRLPSNLTSPDCFENMSQTEPQERRRRRRGIYLLPNLFTTGTLFAGFYAIIAASQGHYSVAGLAIFLAMLADLMDGRIARLTRTESDFGVQFDSLADLVAFGLATGLLSYTYSLHTLVDVSIVGGKLGWLAAFFYSAAAALRLARFNVQSGTPIERKMFVGLPSPAAAGLVAGFVWVGDDLGLSGATLVIPMLLTTVQLVYA